MRLALIAALCLACAAKHPPTADALRSGIDLVEQEIISALRACERFPAKAPARAARRGARMSMEIPPEGWRAFGAPSASADGETFEMELLYNKRDYHAKVRRVGGQPWTIVDDIVPDPCGDETLAVTEDDVDAINAQDLPWKAALIPSNTGKTARHMGIRIDPKRRIPVTGGGYLTVRRALDPLAPTVVGGIALPESYDARDRYAREFPCQAFAVRNQNQCGTCSHFSTSSAVSARLCLQNGRTSATNVLLCADGGGSTAGNLNWYAAQPPRAKEEWCLPYQTQPGACDTAGCPLSRSFSVKDSRLMGWSAPVMQAELLQHGPIVAGFLVEKGFFSYSSGVYAVPNNTIAWVGGHDVMVVGWGVDDGAHYWTVQNSWGPDWGEKGFFRISRGNDEAGIESREVYAFTPVPSLECPNSPCANGSITLADCSCKCTNPLMGGPLCGTLLAQCRNGGRLDQWGAACLCPLGTSGYLCQHGFLVRPADTASCAGVDLAITVQYSLPSACDYRSTLGMYTPAETSPFARATKHAYAFMCPYPGPCNLAGAVLLFVAAAEGLAPGRYRIMPSAANGDGAMYTFDDKSPVAAYHTVLPAASCTPEALQAARDANPLDAPIADSLAASLTAQPAMKARLDAALGPRAQLLAQTALRAPSLSLDGAVLDGGDVYSGSIRPLCYYIPPWMNVPKQNKQLQLGIGRSPFSSYYPITISLPVINFVANPDAVSPNAGCFSATFSSSYPVDTLYTLALVADGGADCVASPPFNMRRITLNAGAPVKTSALVKGVSTITKVALTVGWAFNAPRPGDTLRLIDKNGEVAAPAYELYSATSTATSAIWTVVFPLMPQGPTRCPYLISFYRANSSRSVYTLASPLLVPAFCSVYKI